MEKTRRINTLDALRGIAALAVLLFHYVCMSDYFTDCTIPKKLFFYGQYGVHLFFAISGFVIFMSIKNTKNPFVFIKKRCFRLYPTFWISMILTYVVTSLYGADNLKVSLNDFFINFTMLPTLFGADSVDGVYWTLKIELFFYLIIFILLSFNLIKKIYVVSTVYLLLGLPVIFYRPMLSYYYGLLFLMGINFYQLWMNQTTNKLYNYIQLIIIALFSIGYIDKLSLNIVVVTILVEVVFLLFIYDKLKILRLKLFLFLGKISYALYLVHQYIGYVIQEKLISFGFENPYLLVIIPMIISIGMAYLITYFYEIPIQKKLKR